MTSHAQPPPGRRMSDAWRSCPRRRRVRQAKATGGGDGLGRR